MEPSNFSELVHQRFDAECRDKLDRNDVIGIIAYSEYAEKVDEVMDFLQSHPNATLRETTEYVFADVDGQILEIVDDDELDGEDDWEE